MDNLANAFSTLQNSQMRRKKYVFIPFSKIVWNICTILYVEGFIRGFKKIDISNALDKKQSQVSDGLLGRVQESIDQRYSTVKSKSANSFAYIIIYLKYLNNKPIIEKISKISLQGRRIYTKKIITTPLQLSSTDSFSSRNNLIMHHHSAIRDSYTLQETQNFGQLLINKDSSLPNSANAALLLVEPSLKKVSFLNSYVDPAARVAVRATQGFGLKILSTSKGILCDRDARFLGVGGEVLCEIL